METKQVPSLERGVFTISLDVELIWGTLDLFGPQGFRQAYELERREVIDRLLDLFTEFEVPATWCMLGHLLLDSCEQGPGATKHPEIVRPNHAWHKEDWFKHDPCGNEKSDPLFYGRSLLEKIRACPVPQEIGSHSFSHIIFGDAGCSRETATSELAACVRAATDAGVEMRSFAFPRNQVGHLDVVREHGFTCYRGPDPIWYEQGTGRSLLRRCAHLWDVLRAAAPPVVVPQRAEAGLWNIPGSMIYFPMHGLRRYIPVSLRVRRAAKGLEAAARERRIFHLWFHPTNLAFQMEEMLDGLRAILEYASTLRANHALTFLPMRALVPTEGLPVMSAERA